jgi:hypothetical protein
MSLLRLSFFDFEKKKEEMVLALAKEIRLRKRIYGENVETIYFGEERQRCCRQRN